MSVRGLRCAYLEGVGKVGAGVDAGASAGAGAGAGAGIGAAIGAVASGGVVSRVLAACESESVEPVKESFDCFVLTTRDGLEDVVL